MRVRALYNDGLSAATHRVTVGVDASGLAIMRADEQRISMWPAAGLELVERPIGRSPFRLGCGGAAPRLTFAAPVIESFQEYYPDLKLRYAPGQRDWLQMAGWAGGALLVSIIAWLLAAPLLAQSVAAVISDTAKERLSMQLANQAVALIADRDNRSYDDMICSDQAAIAAMRTLMAPLAQGPGAGVRLGLLAIDGIEPELFALPGGQILLSGAMLEQLTDAEALAGSLAHEIGHIAMDHPTRTLVLLDPVGVLFGLLPLNGSGAAFNASLLHQFRQHGFRESDEEAAEEFALDALNTIGVAVEPYAAFRAARPGADDNPAGSVGHMHPASEENITMLRENGTGQMLALDATQWQDLRGWCQ